ncbi:MAG: hypothetical protein OHK0053_34730 [Microscillaceae bacterium]
MSNPPLIPNGWSFWSGQPTGLTALVQFGSEDGFVVVQGCNVCGCGPSRSIFYPMSSPGGGGGGGGGKGIPIPRAPDGIAVYPNPADASTTFAFEKEVADVYEVRLLDNLGREVWSAQTAEESLVLPTWHLSKGLYFLHFYAVKNKESRIMKLWIQH